MNKLYAIIALFVIVGQDVFAGKTYKNSSDEPNAKKIALAKAAQRYFTPTEKDDKKIKKFTIASVVAQVQAANCNDSVGKK